MRKQAITAVRSRGGDVSNQTEVLSEYVLQFGAFRGQTFKWMIENALGYTGWLVDSMRSETSNSSALSQNKASLKAYAQLFPECKEVIAKKREQRMNKAKEQHTSTTATPSRPSTMGVTAAGRVRSSTAVAVASLLKRNASPHRISAAISRTLANSKRSSTPNIPATRPPKLATAQVPAVRNRAPAVRNLAPAATSRTPRQSPDSSDDEICSIADKVEEEIGTVVFIRQNIISFLTVQQVTN